MGFLGKGGAGGILAIPAHEEQVSPYAGIAFAIKLLVSAREAAALSNGREVVQAQTGGELHISSASELYPGTPLQQVTVTAASNTAMMHTLRVILEFIMDDQGRIMNDSRDMQPGYGSLRVVVPNAAAKSVIGRGGSNIAEIRDQFAIKLHVEQQSIGRHPIQEQVCSLFGEMRGLQGALQNICERIEGECVHHPWFAEWAMTSHAGTDGGLKGQSLLGKNRAGGKNRGKGDDMGKGWDTGKSLGKGWDVGWDAGVASTLPPATTHVDRSLMDMLNHAVDSLPQPVKDAKEWSKVINFRIPESLVSQLIGKMGSCVKEISQSTRAKVQIHKIPDDPSESMVQITGTAVTVCSAYFRCLAKLGEVQSGDVSNVAPYGRYTPKPIGQQPLGGWAQSDTWSDPNLRAAAAVLGH
eukprot:TRINITY_DN16434_c0_g1_i1.p1 TRINITY_DN16434_c0_g1~~TRINITY_DN16434_c0_g1_i1.p1  ORF type:complete len:456 (-),score=68.66 TRINITY_DN16434_c0_g1_i1:41-1273(-)